LDGFHPTGTCGVFGASGAAGRLLGLTTAELVHAFGIAGVQATGLLEFGREKNAMTKRLNPGRAAETGVSSALLAKDGFTGSSEILEGKSGFFQAFLQGKKHEPSKLVEGLGQQFEILKSGMKPYSCCRAFHSAVDAVLLIRNEHDIQPDEISEIVVGCNRIAYAQASPSQYRPSNLLSSQMSLPYNVAKTILGRDMRRQGDSSFMIDEDAVRLATKVKAFLDSELDKDYPEKLACSVRIKDRHGREYFRTVDCPKGDPENPLTEQEVISKFKVLATPVLGTKHSEVIVERVGKLEQFENIDELIRQ